MTFSVQPMFRSKKDQYLLQDNGKIIIKQPSILETKYYMRQFRRI